MEKNYLANMFEENSEMTAKVQHEFNEELNPQLSKLRDRKRMEKILKVTRRTMAPEYLDSLSHYSRSSKATPVKQAVHVRRPANAEDVMNALKKRRGKQGFKLPKHK